MKKKIILFISTNNLWGGSEALWTEAARKLLETHVVKAAVHYGYELIRDCIPEKRDFFDLNERHTYPSLLVKVVQKISTGNIQATDQLSRFLRDKPALVIISQGNNLIGLPAMEFCRAHNLPFVTITHLVSETSWPAMDGALRTRMRGLYQTAALNLFVSKFTLSLHEKILGTDFNNNKITYNPFIKDLPENVAYPEPDAGTYSIALVGRLEIFHKGYDLLFEVVKKEKWKNRPVVFSLFGNGPHLDVLVRWKREQAIDNIIIKQHVENVADIWKEHQLLLMPSRLEGQSLTLIESMRFKRACIVTRVGGVDELVEDGRSGFIAKYPTAEHLEEAMDRAWENRHTWKSMGEAAHQLIKERHPADAVAYFLNQLSSFL